VGIAKSGYVSPIDVVQKLHLTIVGDKLCGCNVMGDMDGDNVSSSFSNHMGFRTVGDNVFNTSSSSSVGRGLGRRVGLRLGRRVGLRVLVIGEGVSLGGIMTVGGSVGGGIMSVGGSVGVLVSTSSCWLIGWSKSGSTCGGGRWWCWLDNNGR
jgi:hypothetical protein